MSPISISALTAEAFRARDIVLMFRWLPAAPSAVRSELGAVEFARTGNADAADSVAQAEVPATLRNAAPISTAERRVLEATDTQQIGPGAEARRRLLTGEPKTARQEAGVEAERHINRRTPYAERRPRWGV